MMQSFRQLIQEPSLNVYFKEQLSEQAMQLEPVPQEETLWYIGDMLARFGHSEQVFIYDDGKHTLRPLALLYSDAFEAKTARMRKLLLRQLGDLALFLGAFCPETFSKKGIGKDYLVGMGGGAYAYLSANNQRQGHIYSELSEAFAPLLELVSSVCGRHHVFNADDVVALYQRWVKTKNPLLKKQLEMLGIETGNFGGVH